MHSQLNLSVPEFCFCNLLIVATRIENVNTTYSSSDVTSVSPILLQILAFPKFKSQDSTGKQFGMMYMFQRFHASDNPVNWARSDRIWGHRVEYEVTDSLETNHPNLTSLNSVQCVCKQKIETFNQVILNNLQCSFTGNNVYLH